MLAIRREKSCECEEQSYKYKCDVEWYGHAYVLCEAVVKTVKVITTSGREILQLDSIYKE